MFLHQLILITVIIGIISILYNNKFFLSIIISLEFLLLNIIVFNIYVNTFVSTLNNINISVYVLALSAVEASIGITITALLSRNLNEVTFNNLNVLKN